VIRATYGAIVEGEYDVGVFEELIRKICSYPVDVWVIEAGGRTRLMQRFPRLLRAFEHATASGGTADRALVIRDSNGKASILVEEDMRQRLQGQTYAFPYGVEVHAVQQETEAWLLGDPAAIGRLAGRPARTIHGRPETLPDAKEAFADVLQEVGLLYTPAVCRRIATEIHLPTLRAACPSFVRFEEKVRLHPSRQ
jgi:hypothetical protein